MSDSDIAERLSDSPGLTAKVDELISVCKARGVAFTVINGVMDYRGGVLTRTLRDKLSRYQREIAVRLDTRTAEDDARGLGLALLNNAI